MLLEPTEYFAARGVTEKHILEQRGVTRVDKGILIPFFSVPDGMKNGYEVRLDESLEDGRKFDRPRGQKASLNIHPSMVDRLRDTNEPLYIVEGTTRCDALAQRGIPSISLAGCWGWLSGKETLSDWDSVKINGREVIIGLDGDVLTKPDVNAALHRLADLMVRKMARAVKVLALPNGLGLDDWFAAGGHVTRLHEHLVDISTVAVLKPKRVRKEDRARKAVGTGINDTSLAQAWVESPHFLSRYILETSQWASYDEGSWLISKNDGIVRGQVTDLLLTYASRIKDDAEAQDLLLSSTKVGSVATAVRSNSAVWMKRDEFDKNPALFNMQNGVYDLDANTFHPHSAQHFVSMKAGASYKPSARAPQFEKFIRWALPEQSTQRFVQKLFGQALIGRVDDQILPIFTGSGGNGKGTLLNAISAVMGDYAAEAKDDLLIETRNESHDEKIAILEGKRMITAEEPKRGKLDMDRAKKLTGNNTWTASLKGQTSRTFDPTWTLVMVTNNLPDFDGEDGDALRRRLRVVPFLQRATEVDVHLGEKLRAEVDGIFLWLLEGLRMWREEGLAQPESVLNASSAAIEDGDTLTRFMAEGVRFTGQSGDRLVIKDLRQTYEKWAQEEMGYGGYKSYAPQKFPKEVETRLMGRAEIVYDGSKAVHGKVLVGAKLVTDSDNSVGANQTLVQSTVQTESASDLQGANSAIKNPSCSTDSEHDPDQLELFSTDLTPNPSLVRTETPSSQVSPGAISRCEQPSHLGSWVMWKDQDPATRPPMKTNPQSDFADILTQSYPPRALDS